MLASDGLETLPEAEIRRLCAERRPAGAIVSDLLAAVEAAARRSQDNTTVIVYRHASAAAIRRRFEELAAPARPTASGG